MPAFNFLPPLPGTFNLLTALGLILVMGLVGARLLTRFAPVPTITGYVLTGLLIGPAVLGLVDAAVLDRISLLIDLALGLVLFELGRRVDYRWLLREKRLLATGMVISISTFIALYWLLTAFGFSKLIASMGAAIGMATSPAAALNVVREIKAEGQLTERLLNIVAISNVLAFLGLSMGLSALHLEYNAGWHSILLHPLYLFLGSGLLGWLVSRVLVRLGGFLGPGGQAQLVLIIALIAATVGIATMFKLSALIALLVFGVSSRSTDSRYAVIEPDFSQFNALLYVFLFVFAGIRLEFAYLVEMAGVALAFILARFAITIFFTSALSTLNGMTVRKGALLGIGLMPLSGFKMIMVQHAASAYPQFNAQLAALMVSILLFMEVIGPVCTRYALMASGEAKPEDGKAAQTASMN